MSWEKNASRPETGQFSNLEMEYLEIARAVRFSVAKSQLAIFITTFP